MKKKIICLVPSFLLIIMHFCLATIRTVSNDPAYPAQFTDIQNAINVSSANDSIYVHGSTNYYSSFTLNFKLTIIGPGFSPQKQNTAKAMMNSFSFINIFSSASGSSIEGMYLPGSICTVGGGTLSNIQIVRNYIGRIYNNGGGMILANWVIQNNYFDTYPNGTNINMGGAQTISNWLILNNYFRATAYWCITNFPSPGTSGVIIDHNIFTGNNTYYLFDYVNNFSISNNIFFSNYFSPNVSNCIYFNNITYLCNNNTPWTSGTANTDGGGNLINLNPSVVDQNTIQSNIFDLNGNYQVQNAAALTGASDGTAMGIYGGNANWANARMPAFPYIYSIVGSPVVQAGASFNITINAKTGN